MWPFGRKTGKDSGESDAAEPYSCSFCQKAQDKVRKLVAGPTVFICDECVALCNEIIEDELGDYAKPEARSSPINMCLRCRMVLEDKHEKMNVTVCTTCAAAIQVEVEQSPYMSVRIVWKSALRITSMTGIGFLRKCWKSISNNYDSE